ncbi:MAG TPA: ParA family protein [Flavobacterium sp.]
MTKIIAICNRKGGVGKTTSTINIAASLNLKKKKVLVIDLDPQANLTQSLGVTEKQATENNIYEALFNVYEPKPIEIIKGLFVIPSTLDLAGAESDLLKDITHCHFYLKDLIDEIKHNYDYVLIDCLPSLGLLVANAFVAADEILIPVQSEYMATQGLNELFDLIGKVKKILNPSIEVGGLFMTRYDNRKTLNKAIFNYIKEEYPDKIFITKIRDNVAISESSLSKIDIFRYNSKSHGAEDYQELTNEIIKRHKNDKSKKTS